MKKCAVVILGLFLIFVIYTKTANAQGLKEGQWSMSMVTKMENMPPQMAAAMQQMKNMPPQALAAMKQAQAKAGIQMTWDDQGMTVTSKQCITNQNPIPMQQKGCQETHEINGGTVTFNVTCSQNGVQAESSGSMTYQGDSMNGTIKTHTQTPGTSMDQTMDITGQYLGPCP